ncbi:MULTISPECIES: pleiotropic regulatory protein RsmS [unclassified Brenneria]|uniref:pleiotropic regulatory protein RsmS n=1 Tax=unclassified Brenneria TaxID=2634434 RepID=UPI0015520714|nr:MULTISPECIES: pleiotropic regulatory protein RsmS [unclassified Brenneria]MBJ7221793.1 pleiotropic regulatory protein RsmS [Brenneria sp. L3-3C-1]MEE3643036.1 pleiotropic regulatory protein RsmS [Brenneria sp. L3_3C_1]MEE3650778.1 pleiotropic regulatory protein RsmS [Brenneria sp. HEZEL_4_2_4]NPD00733.1 pleiotropic regulatory protein RsmS [Brenneria sp. hezel4-2-4]
MSLENAAPEIKLAVDLIMLLEDNQIEPQVVLAALDIVRNDFQKKAQQEKNTALK